MKRENVPFGRSAPAAERRGPGLCVGLLSRGTTLFARQSLLFLTTPHALEAAA